MSSKNKKPSFQFYPGDWRKDQDLARASLKAKGALIEILCLAFECEKSGYLKTGNVPWTIDEIAYAMGGDKYENIIAVEELLSKKILKKNKKNCIFSARMVRDEQIKRKRIKGGELGGIHGVKGKDFGIFGGRPVKKPPLQPPIKPPPSSSSSSSLKENIKKENEKWNQYPRENDVGEVEEKLISKVIEAVKISQNVSLSQDDVLQLWRIFKTESLTGDDFYQTENKVCVHFIRWAKGQKIAPKNLNGQQPNIPKSIKELVKKYE